MAFWLVGFYSMSSWAQDVVLVRSKDARTVAKRKGEVLDYTGDSLTLRLVSGRMQRIESNRVLSLETKRTESHQLAADLFKQGKYAAALQRYRLAEREEKRSWMLREIFTKEVQCYQNKGEIVAAAQRFLLILESDRAARCFGVIPLRWTAPRSLTAFEEENARQWLRGATVAERLIGASWMMATSQRAQAVNNLESLTADNDLRIGFLAEAQLWRIKLVTASADEVGIWRQRIQRMPEELRAGPCFLLGKGLARQERYLDACLELLRIPILHSHLQTLVPEALLIAGQCLESAGQKQEAELVYREILDLPEGLPTTSAARKRLQQVRQERGL
ncbi:MAG: hypothetical protein CMJ75_07530 [Planctomycetaceae bacterium]|nr:hypothetical protein [Planctomycetaceae bacterium]